MSLSVVAAIVILTTVFAVIGQPSIAVQPKPFGGSLTLNDVQDPVVVDLATGSPNLRLQGIESQVGATDPSVVDAVPLADGTLLVNRSTGTFNVLGLGNSIVKTSGGIALGDLPGTTGAAGFAAGDNGYIVRYAPTAATISLVDQATVAAAARTGTGTPGTGALVPLLGFADVAGSIPTTPGSTVVANGDLWTITRGSGSGTLQRFAAGEPGKQLAASQFGSVDPVAALTTGSTNGGDVVALAEPADIRILQPAPGGGTPRTTTVPVAAGTHVDQIVPVGDGQGQVLFAYHTTGGWRLAGVDLATGQALAVRVLTGLPAKASLESPVINDGSIYAIADDGSTTPPLVKIDPGTGSATPLAGASSYPVAGAGEQTTFVDPGLPPQVISVGPRVIINNPNRVLAVVVFTDGSRPTRVIDKRTAVDVNPSSLPGATTGTTATNAPAKDVVSQPQQVDTQLRCKTITQKPRVPVLDQPVPASHSVSLSWSYTLLDNQDCEPTSYLVTVATVGGGPSPPTTQFPVNGQTQFTVPGLRPNTTYSFVVTALINTQSTPSLPQHVTTNPQGPDAPLSVTTVANGNNGWTVSWNVCQGDACDSNLPAATWTVTGSSCGSGSQFIGTPPVVTVPGTGGAVQSATVPFDQFPTLVGDQLTFSVQGTSATGLAGDSTGDGSCTEGWRPADPSLFTVSGSATADSGGSSVTASLTVAPDSGVTPIQAFGSNSVRFSFSVLDQTTNQTSPPQTVSSPSATFAGLAPGHTYVPQVSVTPLISPTAGSTVQGNPFGTTVPWPSGITATQVGQATVSQGDPNTGTATFAIA
ncbi:MAG TPA: fibronectin type III domain-containing protein, partial [Acidimicrobiales bacterium]|nr:fibronectin type III domain-containing protein [Acidimicrobiales bacterium]